MEQKICCPKCGSDQITADQKGFSGGKALAGAVLTGGVGLLAGTIGSKDVIVTCLACGNQWKAGGVKPKILLDHNESENLDNEALELMRAGKKLDAFKLIEKSKGIKPMDAFKYGKELAAKNGIEFQKPKGCFGILLIPTIIGGASMAYFVYHVIQLSVAHM